jgi:hypothetical protein
LLLLLHDKPGDSVPLNQHKKEKQQTTQECAGHWCEVIKNKLILSSAHGFFFFFSWRSVLQSTNLPIKHYVKPPQTNTHTHTHTQKLPIGLPKDPQSSNLFYLNCQTWNIMHFMSLI